MVREIKGKHVLIGFVGAFGVIIAVNVVMAVNAVKTFPGLEVKNSYIASQEFNSRKAAQEALGWTLAVEHQQGEIRLAFKDAQGAPLLVGGLEAVIGRPTTQTQGVTPQWRFDGSAYVAKVDLAPGNWNLRLTAVSQNGTEFSQTRALHIKG